MLFVPGVSVFVIVFVCASGAVMMMFACGMLSLFCFIRCVSFACPLLSVFPYWSLMVTCVLSSLFLMVVLMS